MDKDYSRKRLFLLFGFGFGFLFLVLVVSFFASQRNEPVKIEGFSEISKNISQETYDTILNDVHTIIKQNNGDDIDPSKIEDIIIRDNSYSQTEIVVGREYFGNFIIDIESLKQSYAVQYSYSDLEETGFTGGYPVMVSCLEEEKLIYGPFDCVDLFKIESGELDPVLFITPHTTLNYEVHPVQKEDGVVDLRVNLIVTEVDRKLGVEDAVRRYKGEFRAWMAENNLDPDDYVIEYSY